MEFPFDVVFVSRDPLDPFWKSWGPWQPRKRLYYPIVRHILRWLPVDVRAKLSMRAPSIRSVEKLLPYRFKDVALSYVGAEEDAWIAIDKLYFHVVPRWDDPDPGWSTVSLDVRNWTDRSVESPDPPLWSVETDVEVELLVEAILAAFLRRPGCVTEWLEVTPAGMAMFGDLLSSLEVKSELMCLFRTDNLDNARNYRVPEGSLYYKSALRIRAPHLSIGTTAAQLNFRTIVETVIESRRAVGSNFEVWFKYEEETGPCFLLNDMLTELDDLNPRRGVVPRDRTERRYEREDLQTATVIQCVFFEMEHADLAVCTPDLGDVDAEVIVKVVIVEKGTVEHCEPDDWLTTFELDDSVSYMKMA